MPLWDRNIDISELNNIIRRGGSFQTTITDSVYPTARPSSSYHHGKPLPTIAGSFGGFLGLVIGLGVFAIITSTAAFCLYKRYKRNKRFSEGGAISDFPKPGGLFGRKKKKGWMQTHSYTDGHDEDEIPMGGNQHYAADRGRPYEDPFNAESLDNLQRETSAQIDRGPEYHRVARGEGPPLPLEGGTKFKEGL
ncbi:hypothetical protein FRC14_001986 [Serendipita sp. 396]|nr:hypothetical protein FRC14_001986 [Serendipita sp. 396]KAG8785324.1 hypothetical protein FRC15_001597 [Serendipita sp. 397]KAG8801934.1 hypothetical protein FRC16_010764 [Serendipita sp. 398]KAG8838789.1 hypothetical protein FRC18_002855 [Serendipita sp. 400]